MADQEKKKNAAAPRAEREKQRMRVLRAKQAASKMARQELLAKLMFVEEEKQILQNELNAKLSCQQESLAQAAHLPPLRSPLALCEAFLAALAFGPRRARAAAPLASSDASPASSNASRSDQTRRGGLLVLVRT